ncbi:MAG TPA: hypothetical protein VFO76_07785 [Candidatus Kapabacteria bacterium]|nr:hypothetical protein [Candidatus Kapabacteria bacterium]
MKAFLLTLSFLFLLFNASGAFFGGLNLMTHPDGSSIALPYEYIKTTAFKDYFIPGLILLLANGVFDLLVCAAIVARIKRYPLLIISAGVILGIWLLVQIIIIQILYYLQFILALDALGMILCGWLLRRMQKKELA